MAENFADSILSGVEGGVGLAQKVEQIQEQRRKVEEDKKNLILQRSDYMTNKMYKALTLPDAVREDAFKSLAQEAEMLKMPLNPAVLKLANTPELRTQVLQGLADLALLPDTDRGRASVSALGNFSASPENFVDNLQKYAATREKLLQAQATKNPTGTDVLQNTEKAIGTFKSQFGTEGEVIRQVNNLNTLAADPARRKQAFPGDAANVILAKLLDPATGVREAEVERVTGLGTGALSTVQNSLNKAKSGQILSEVQWKQILAVSNLIGQKGEERIDKFKSTFEPTLKGAGVNPETVYSAVPKLEPFDFAKNFGKAGIPVGLKQFDEAGKKQVAANIENGGVKMSPELQKAFAAAGLKPGTPQFQAAYDTYKKSKTPGGQAQAAAPAAPASGMGQAPVVPDEQPVGGP